MIIILTNQRCGSHHLCSMIEANGYKSVQEIVETTKRIITDEFQVSCLYENADLQKCPAEMRRQGQKLIQQRFSSVARRVISRGTVGILHRYQIHRFSKHPEKETQDLKSHFKGARFIHLTRDPVDSAVSFYVALKTGKWFSFVSGNRSTPEYNFEDLKKVYDRYTKELVWPETVLSDLGAVHVRYEDLISDAPGTMAKLGFSVHTQDKFKKQSDPLKAEFKNQFIKDLKKAA